MFTGKRKARKDKSMEYSQLVIIIINPYHISLLFQKVKKDLERKQTVQYTVHVKQENKKNI